MSNLHLQSLGEFSGGASADLSSQILTAHRAIASRYASIDRVALAAYDPLTDSLKTFVSSNHDGVRLDHYEARLNDVPSLKSLVNDRQIRVVDDIDDTFAVPTGHTSWLKSRDYRSSLTVPIFQGRDLAAFLFFDSKQPRAFDAETTAFLEIFSNLITQLYLLQLQVAHNMAGTVQVASGLARIRDLETGQHLERMAAYSRLMALELAQTRTISDEFIEYVFLFAPLHDIGKVGIPDRVLLKPGRLDPDEWVVMRRHVEIGESIVNQMALNLSQGNGLAYQVMRNIVVGHHERGDGSGYPAGLKMAQIPLEARIVAVADVYDALSNRRPYKQAWAEAECRGELDKEVALGRLDGDCVNVLMAAHQERLKIQEQFRDQ